uniref:Aminoacyl-tRNA synthetase, class 1a, anticodon-binding n=1 Tax=Tanacetum cinerariifolium TaxID=118510 RepID=A0A6L2M220_TANCI|nr:aminoacyl-tRNA synthetase, class 1a, anticodon-binding [Tanacetum cinerariifolium]
MESTLHLFLRLIGGMEEGKHIEPPLYNFLKGYESSKEEEEDISRTASFGLFMPPSFRIGLYGKLLAKEEDKISRRPSFGDISNLYKGLLQEGKKISRLPSFESFLNLYKAPLQEEEKISRTLSFGYFSNRYKAPLQEEEEEAPQLSDISNLHEESLQEEKKISKALEEEDKRWSLHDEMSMLFNALLNRCFPEFEEEADLFPCYKTEHGDYNCQNVLTIWPKLTKSLELRDDHPHIKRPRDVGIAIQRDLRDTALDMIEGQPSVFDVGFVTFSLSLKWMAERIHMMLKDGIDTWAPILPVERVLVKYPSLDEEIHTGLFRRSVIAETLVRMLSYSKVDATMTPTIEKDMLDSPLDILKRCFLIEERSGGDLVIGVDKDKPPFILAKKDLNRLYADLAALRYGFEKDKADWIVYVTPVRQQEYIEMCFTVAKLENWTPTVRKWKWIPDGTIYAGYRTCTETIGLDFLLRLNTRCLHVAEGEDVKSLGYTSFEVCRCVIRVVAFCPGLRFVKDIV